MPQSLEQDVRQRGSGVDLDVGHKATGREAKRCSTIPFIWIKQIKTICSMFGA